MHVWPEEIAGFGDWVELRARVESAGADSVIWFRVPAIHRERVSASADPFVIAALFAAMREGEDLHVHGEVSPLLLTNLEELQAIWSCWRPDRYRQCSIFADSEREAVPCDSGEAVVAFSGGLDACFSTWRHRNGKVGRRNRNLTAGVMAHGFDVPLDQPDVFERAAENSRRILETAGMELIPVVTNFRDQRYHWEDAHGAGIASVLHLLSRGYSRGVIASSNPYGRFRSTWGSTPLTDPLFRSGAFSIDHDGAGFERSEKARLVSEWPEAMKRMRVCFFYTRFRASGESTASTAPPSRDGALPVDGERQSRNCGACRKCVHTALCFAVERVPLPPSLGITSLERSIVELPQPPWFDELFLIRILEQARETGLTEPWVRALARVLRIYRRRNLWLLAKDVVARRRSP